MAFFSAGKLLKKIAAKKVAFNYGDATEVVIGDVGSSNRGGVQLYPGTMIRQISSGSPGICVFSDASVYLEASDLRAISSLAMDAGGTAVGLFSVLQGFSVPSSMITADADVIEGLNHSVAVDTTAGPIVAKLPDVSFTDGSRFVLYDYAGTFSTNNLTITTDGGTTEFGPDAATSVVLSSDGDWIEIEWIDADGRYAITSMSSTGGGGVQLSDNNVWTGTNEFDNNVTVQSGATLQTKGATYIKTSAVSGDITTSDTNHQYFSVDLSGGPITITLTEPSFEQVLEFKDAGGNAGTNPLTIDGDGVSIDGNAVLVVPTNYGYVRLVYDGQWQISGTYNV